jgi:hypothetical protein
MRLIVCALAGMLLAVTAAGCGTGMLKTKGRLVKGGTPLATEEDDVVRVIFMPVVEKGEVVKDYFMAQFNPADGTFQVVGKDGKGLPPGKYRISVQHLRKKKDLLNGAFGGDTSPFVYDVNASTPELVLDLSRPKG